MTRVYVVGEVGPSFVYGPDREVNEATLVRLIDAIADAGADCVKGQLKALGGFYVGDDLSRPPHDPTRAPFATRGDYVAAREPDAALLKLLSRQCFARGIEWTASPWDVESCELLERFSPPWVKVASASLPDDELLIRVRQMGAPVVLSTGGATLEQIEHAVQLLEGMHPVRLAVCTMRYPARVEDLNLSRIKTLREHFRLSIGWSSHSPDHNHAQLAVAAGATWIEQHVTTGKLRWGPDHATSLTPSEFAECVWRIRQAELAMGAPEIRVLECEREAVARLRKVS